MTSPVDKTHVLEPGEKAPDFRLKAYPRGSISLEQCLTRRLVVLAFYPCDGLPGCTREMAAFSDLLPVFLSAGAQVLGVSCDSVTSHAKFARQHRLEVPLLADEDRTVGRAYGAIRSDRIMADRVTFVIDRKRTIRHVVAGMPDTVALLDVVQHLKGS